MTNSDVMTMAETEAAFPGEWVLIAEPETGDEKEVIRAASSPTEMQVAT
jgi:hypothetical protein